MKKIISLFVCLVLIFALSVTVFASGTASVSSSASTNVVKLGDTVTVTVSLSDCEPFKSMALTPTYDTSVFEMVSGEWLLTGAMLASFDNANAAIAYSSEVTKSGNVFRYVLKVKDNATRGNTAIKTTAVIKNGSTVISSAASGVTVNVTCKTHSFSDWVNADSSNHKRTCSACGAPETAAHAWDSGEITKIATCKEAGIKTITCTVCNTTKTETIEKTNDHKFGSYNVTKEPTCTEQGEKVRVCSVCDLSETAKVNALGHKMGKWTQTKAPTCSAQGAQERKCSTCSAVEKKSVAAIAHQYGSATTTKEATCTENGSQSLKCKVCGNTTTKTVNAKGHTFGEAVVTKEATDTETGIKTFTCTVCNGTKEEVIPCIANVPDATVGGEDVEPTTEATEPVETTEAIEPETTTEPTVATDEGDSAAPESKLWILIVAIVIVGCVAALITLGKKK